LKRSSLLGHVVEALDMVRSTPDPADKVLQQFFRERRYLGSSDRRFIGDRLFSVLRNFHFLSFLLDRHPMSGGAAGTVRHPAVLMVLAHERAVMHEDPADLGGHMAGHWRIAGRTGDPAQFLGCFPDAEPLLASLDLVSRVATELSIPSFVVREWVDRFGVEEAEALCRAMNQPAGTVIRANTLKSTPEECRLLLLAEGIHAEPAASAPEGLVLQKRVNVQSLKSFKDGRFELQDEGSQLVTHLLAPKGGERIVDACAGGGGKTLHCASLMNNRGNIFSLDIDDAKLRTLDLRCRRAGVTIARAISPRREARELSFLDGTADGVLVDAPCSGVGTFRRNPGLKVTFSEERAATSAVRQAMLLDRYSVFVKPGGRLVYATCSLLRMENEEIVERFLALHPEFRLVPVGSVGSFPSIPSASPDYLLLLPHRTRTDGFFAALMLRTPASD
jgi:16S rRNA (cytosine967-C5)-methyltransferase